METLAFSPPDKVLHFLFAKSYISKSFKIVSTFVLSLLPKSFKDKLIFSNTVKLSNKLKLCVI